MVSLVLWMVSLLLCLVPLVLLVAPMVIEDPPSSLGQHGHSKGGLHPEEILAPTEAQIVIGMVVVLVLRMAPKVLEMVFQMVQMLSLMEPMVL